MQIIIAAVLAIAIGLTVSSTVEEVPTAAITLVRLPGDCWLRALKCVGMLQPNIALRIYMIRSYKHIHGCYQYPKCNCAIQIIVWVMPNDLSYL